MWAPPAGFEPALPPPEGGALSPELRGPGETIYQREACPARPGSILGAWPVVDDIGSTLPSPAPSVLLLLAGCVHAAAPAPAVIRDSPPPWDAPRDAVSYIEAAALVPQPLDSTENRHVTQVTITVDGAPVQIPAYVGVDRVRAVQAAVHTHDTSGAVWLEGRDTGDDHARPVLHGLGRAVRRPVPGRGLRWGAGAGRRNSASPGRSARRRAGPQPARSTSTVSSA